MVPTLLNIPTPTPAPAPPLGGLTWFSISMVTHVPGFLLLFVKTKSKQNQQKINLDQQLLFCEIALKEATKKQKRGQASVPNLYR